MHILTFFLINKSISNPNQMSKSHPKGRFVRKQVSISLIRNLRICFFYDLIWKDKSLI
jgi:hypothetical protein